MKQNSWGYRLLSWVIKKATWLYGVLLFGVLGIAVILILTADIGPWIVWVIFGVSYGGGILTLWAKDRWDTAGILTIISLPLTALFARNERARRLVTKE